MQNLIVSFVFNKTKFYPQQSFYPSEDLVNLGFKPRQAASRLSYLNEVYKTKKSLVFVLDKTKDLVKNSKHRRVEISKKICATAAIKSLLANLIDGNIFIDVTDVYNDYDFMLPILQIAKNRKIFLIRFKKLNGAVKITQIVPNRSWRLDDLSQSLKHFEATLHFGKLPKPLHTDAVACALSNLSANLLRNNLANISKSYKALCEILEDDLQIRQSVFLPLVPRIKEILERLKLPEIKHCSLPKYGERFSIFHDYFSISKVYSERGYFINAAIMAFEGINYGCMMFFLHSSVKKYSHYQKSNATMNGLKRLISRTFQPYADLKNKAVLCKICALYSELAMIRNSLVHLDLCADYELLCQKLFSAINQAKEVFSDENLLRLERDRLMIAEQIEEVLRSECGEKKRIEKPAGPHFYKGKRVSDRKTKNYAKNF